jgi:hypothetical protein
LRKNWADQAPDRFSSASHIRFIAASHLCLRN